MHFYILIRSWNCLPYLHKCLDSVLSQKFDDYTILFVDDCSEYTREQRREIRERLRHHICVFNKERKFALLNAYELIHKYAEKKNSVVVNVDGDDWLLLSNTLSELAKVYLKKDYALTYGNCLYYAPGTKLHNKVATETNEYINLRYSQAMEKNCSYRKEFFYPLHLRTWKADAFKDIPKPYFLRPDGSWIKFCEDQAILFPLLEKSNGNYAVLTKPFYCYNVENPLNDQRVNAVERLADEVFLRKMKIDNF